MENSRQEAETSAKATAQTTIMIEQNQEKMKLMMDAMNKIYETSQKVVDQYSYILNEYLILHSQFVLIFQMFHQYM